MDPGDWRLVLVNSQHVLDAEHPVELTEVAEGCLFDVRAADSLQAMLADAEKEGIHLVIISTYRSFERSRTNFNNKVTELRASGLDEEAAKREAARWIAPPGMSEHNTGLAVDVVSQEYYNQYGRYLDTPFEEYDGFRWLIEHCAEYGFILRFPDDKEDVTGIHYEPWHYRYVGQEHAKLIMERGITLEEYLEGK